ncbi:Aspartyl/asparaginyl beta-hydroxylase [Frankliniella fusca]|uniref:Aspartyl/asparaginyl beta-hydroxylase n=1 Tax=Frankliniella fusca TaxID=407009 RepID=A0AAE1LRR0_9NEOP|nr:Aspartyl/asparaginyl beta-hydroxylase [Frankliniella fusca]
MYAFILMLEERKFESIPRLRVTLECGTPVTIEGKEAVVLGTGMTRAEAKFRGTEYYNRVCKWHGEEEADWTFDTQDVGANGDAGDSPNSDEERTRKRKCKGDSSEESLQRRKKPSSE